MVNKEHLFFKVLPVAEYFLEEKVWTSMADLHEATGKISEIKQHLAKKEEESLQQQV